MFTTSKPEDKVTLNYIADKEEYYDHYYERDTNFYHEMPLDIDLYDVLKQLMTTKVKSVYEKMIDDNEY